MADSKTQRRNSQQNLLNYISHNLGKKNQRLKVVSSKVKWISLVQIVVNGL